MFTRPKISVIMPVYNAEKYLDLSIKSILSQSLDQIELICVDDCSPDNSRIKLKEFQKKDNRIVIVENKINSGPGPSRNNGIKKARGEFIMFVDSDDSIEKNACEVLYKKAKEESAEVVYLLPKIIFKNKIKLDKRILNPKEVNDPEAVFKKNLLRQVGWAPWSKIVKRDLIIKNKIIFPEIFIVEDFVFATKVLFFAKKISFCKEYLYNYYIREGSLMDFKNPKRRIENYLLSIKLIEEFLNSKKILKKYQKEFIYFKLYTYCAINGVFSSTSSEFEKKEYKKIIANDTDFTISKVLRLKKFDKVTLGSILIKLGMFDFIFRFGKKLVATRNSGKTIGKNNKNSE